MPRGPMLPFLKPKKLADTIITSRRPNGTKGPEHAEGSEHAKLVPAAEAIISAVHAKDADALAKALNGVFQALEADEAVNEQE